MTKKEKKVFLLTAVLCLFFAVPQKAQAMHIMEGYLPPKDCVLWFVLCIPFIAAGFMSLKKITAENKKALIILAMAGAFTFVLSSLKIPSVTGSSSHPTGTGFGAVIFGPWVMSIIGVIVLVFQALLLAHGGITTLGANTFSMAVAGPFVSYGVYKLCRKLKAGKFISVALAAGLGDLFTYCVTSFQLSLAYPSPNGGIFMSMIKFLAIFAVTQIPLAIIEGIITALALSAIEKISDLDFDNKGILKREA